LTCGLSWERIGVSGVTSAWRLEHETPREKSFAAILIRCGWKSPVTSFGRAEHLICLPKQTKKERYAISNAGRAGVGTPRARQSATVAESPSRLRRLLPSLGRLFHSPCHWSVRNVIRRFRQAASSAVSAAQRFRLRPKRPFRNSPRGPLRPSRWLLQFPPGSRHKLRRRVSLGYLLRWLVRLGRHSNPHPQSSQPRRQFRPSPDLSRRESAPP
jgi:hypothetical protein